MFLKILSKIYGLVVSIRNKYYDNNTSKLVKLDCPVISVGNLSVGGTGKTPFVHMLTKYFLSKNLKPVIVGRGYKKRKKGIVEAHDGKKFVNYAKDVGDEMFLLARKLRIPVIAGEKKWETAQFAEKKFNPDLIIIDDGFQHRKLHRDIDIVIIDQETIDKSELLPYGKLREPINSLLRADIIVLAGYISLDKNIKKYIREDAIIIRVVTIQASPYKYFDKNFYNLDELKDEIGNVVAFAGIAKPDRFFDMITNLGLNIEEKHIYSDHFIYKKNDILKLIDNAKKNNIRILATTEKDAVKVAKYRNLFQAKEIELLVFPIAFNIVKGKNYFFKYLSRFLRTKGLYEK